MINKYVLFIILMLIVGSSFLLYDNFESITFSTVSESTTTTKLKNSASSTTTTVPETTTTTSTTTSVPETTTTTSTTTTTTSTTTTVPETTTTTSTTTTVPEITNIIVTVSNDGSGSEYYLNGSKGSTINVSNGATYRFDQSDSSNSGHPLRISTSQEGSQYTMNVTIYGTPGNSGAYTEIEITVETPSTLYIYCSYHFGMGANNVLLKS